MNFYDICITLIAMNNSLFFMPIVSFMTSFYSCIRLLQIKSGYNLINIENKLC